MLLYEDEIRSVEGPDAPASAAGGRALSPIPVEVGGRVLVSKGTLEDSARVRGCSWAGETKAPPVYGRRSFAASSITLRKSILATRFPFYPRELGFRVRASDRTSRTRNRPPVASGSSRSRGNL